MSDTFVTVVESHRYCQTLAEVGPYQYDCNS